MIQQYKHNSAFLPKSSAMKKRPYIKVSSSKKYQLIELVVKEHLNIKTAAVRLGINYSAAKHIVKLFKEERRPGSHTKESKVGENTEPKKLRSRVTLNPISDFGTNNKTLEVIAAKFSITNEHFVPVFDFGVYGQMICER